MYNVYVKGYVGNLGTKVLIEEKYHELANYFGKEFIDKEKLKFDSLNLIEDGFDPSLSIYKDNIKDVEEITKGGFLTALWKICDRNKWGLRYNLRLVPIYQSTVEIANYFDINPYRLLTKCAYILVVDTDLLVAHAVRDNCSCELCEPLVAHAVRDNVGASSASPTVGLDINPLFIKIGEIVNTKKRVRIDGEAEAFLTKDYKDEIDKIINKYTKKKDG